VAHPIAAVLVLLFALVAIIGLKRWWDSRVQIRFKPTNNVGTPPASQWGLTAHRSISSDPAQEISPTTSKEQRVYQQQLKAVGDAYWIEPVKILEKGETRPFYAALDALEALKPE